MKRGKKKQATSNSTQPAQRGKLTLREWLAAMPPEEYIGKSSAAHHTMAVDLTLHTDEWLAAKFAAQANDMTIDQLVTYLLTTKYGAFSNLINFGYRLESDAD